MKPIAASIFVFCFILFVAFHTYTGFIYNVLGVRPRAIVAIDTFIDWVFISTIGLLPTVIFLVLFAPAGAYMAYRRAKRAS